MELPNQTTMAENSQNLCPEPDRLPDPAPRPLATPLWPASVYRCDSPAEALALLRGEADGYVYQRDGHPNADLFAEKCRKLHGAERAAVTSSGMSALAAVLLSQVAAGDHLVVSHQLYGRSLDLLVREAPRLGAECTLVDTCNLEEVQSALRPNTKLVVVETISNPLLRVANLPKLAEFAHRADARLVVDNSFASPVLCRPLEWGADFVVESVTKIINGHGDVMLGLVCGKEKYWEQMARMLSVWGLASSPFDCWMAARGLLTLHLRVKAACENAFAAAQFLGGRTEVASVHYPGLASHVDFGIVQELFKSSAQAGWMVTFDLAGTGDLASEAAAAAFMREVSGEIPFCPSLGEVSTTLSHPASTSHRGLSPAEQKKLGIGPETIRLSLGVESSDHVLGVLERGLRAISGG